jgi:hypothetical protein
MDDAAGVVVIPFEEPGRAGAVYLRGLPPAFDYDDAERLVRPFGLPYRIVVKHAPGACSREAVSCVVVYYDVRAAAAAVAALHGRRLRGRPLEARPARPPSAAAAALYSTPRALAPDRCFALVQYYAGVDAARLEVLASEPMPVPGPAAAATAAAAAAAGPTQWRARVRLWLPGGEIECDGLATVADSPAPLPPGDRAARTAFLVKRAHAAAVMGAFAQVALRVWPTVAAVPVPAAVAAAAARADPAAALLAEFSWARYTEREVDAVVRRRGCRPGAGRGCPDPPRLLSRSVCSPLLPRQESDDELPWTHSGDEDDGGDTGAAGEYLDTHEPDR